MSHFITIDVGQLQQQQDTIVARGHIDMDTFRILATDDLYILPGSTGALRTSAGGDARGDRAIDFQKVRTLDSQVASGVESMVCHGHDNTASGDYSFVSGRTNKCTGEDSSIVSGRNNECHGAESGIYDGVINVIDVNSPGCTMVGGEQSDIVNTIQGGVFVTKNALIQNSARANILGGEDQTINGSDYSVIVGGSGNTVSTGNRNTIVGSKDSSATGNYAAVIASKECQASHDYSGVTGFGAKTSNYGEHARSAGAFSELGGGSAQVMNYTLRVKTTDDTDTNMRPDGDTEILIIPEDTAWAYDVLICGFKDNGAKAGAYHLRGICRRTGAGTPVNINTVKTELGEDDSSWNAYVNTGTTTFRPRVRGKSGETIYWVADVRIVQVRL